MLVLYYQKYRNRVFSVKINYNTEAAAFYTIILFTIQIAWSPKYFYYYFFFFHEITILRRNIIYVYKNRSSPVMNGDDFNTKRLMCPLYTRLTAGNDETRDFNTVVKTYNTIMSRIYQLICTTVFIMFSSYGIQWNPYRYMCIRKRYSTITSNKFGRM